MSEQMWEAPIVELSQDMTAWVVWALSRDLERWHSGRRTRLAREEAVSLTVFLSDFLETEQKTEIATVPPPQLRVG